MTRLSFVESIAGQKGVRTLRNAVAKTGTAIGIVDRVTVKAFSALCRAALLPPLSRVIAPYIKIDRQLAWFTVLSLRVTGFAIIRQGKSLKDAPGPLSGPDAGYWESYGGVSGQNIALRYNTYTLFDMRPDKVGNNALYEINTPCCDLKKFPSAIKR